MRTSDWDNTDLNAIGRKWAKEAYDLASEMTDYGADAAALLAPQWDPTGRPPTVTLPTMMADAIMTILLSLPRPEWAPDKRADARDSHRDLSSRWGYEMTRLLAVVAGGVLLAACATQKTWYREGASQQDFSMDQGQCQAQGFSVAG
jgi:hypothetical protein